MILITGSAGYVASYLIPALQEDGHDLFGLDRESTSLLQSEKQLVCDLCDGKSYSDQLAGVDTVVHLAAAKGDWGISDAEYHRDNVVATETLLSVTRGRGIRNWQFYSTVSAIGPSAVGADENATPKPTNAYGRTKLGCEELFRQLANDDPEASVTVLRPSVVFGPDNPWNTNIYRLIDAIHRRRFVMVGDGSAIKTTSYIENLVAASIFLMRAFPPGYRTYHYVDSPEYSTGELVELIRSDLGQSGPPLRVPLWLAKSIASFADFGAEKLDIDFPITSARIRKFCTPTKFTAKKIRAEGFSQPVGFEDAITKTVEWYESSMAGK